MAVSNLASLRLQSFRSYLDGSFEFSSGVNIIVGPNASGKTNLLEAILMIASGSTYRGRDQLVVRFGSDWARLDGLLTNGAERTLKLEVVASDTLQKSLIIDGKPHKRFSAPQTIPVVLFEPNHLSLIAGEPAERREYLDSFAASLDTTLHDTLKRYRRILFQRNRLLKTNASQNQFFVWDMQFAELAEKIVAARAELIRSINKKITNTYKQLGGKANKIELSYTTKIAYDQSYGSKLLARLKSKHTLELETGFTVSGPHRDDFVVLFGGVDARERASRGEVRSLLLALKIIELEMSSKTQSPILLLDDVFSELDGRRRKALAERLKNYQTFITTTDADVVIEHFQEGATIIAIG
jgi:DNA replication and repair protein RecF